MFKTGNAPVLGKMNMNILISEGAIKYQASKNKTEIRDKTASINNIAADEQMTHKVCVRKKNVNENIYLSPCGAPKIVTQVEVSNTSKFTCRISLD